MHVGWLLASALVDGVRGTKAIAYPYHEVHAVRELGKQLSGQAVCGDTIVAIMALAYFEVSIALLLPFRVLIRVDRLFGWAIIHVNT
jgi:hypothetical protein